MRKRQKGLGWFGSLIVLALAVGAGYYVYQQLAVPDASPSCEAALNGCIHKCRQTASDAASMQSCQQACREEETVCKSFRR
jgi:hypothetical protein